MSPDTSLCGVSKACHLAARLGCAETKVATWDDLAFKLIILGLNVICLNAFIAKHDTTPIDYAALNKLYKDFETRFVPQTELSAEQAFWSHNSVSSLEPNLSVRPTNVEVPKELPKVSMVNTSLKKLKYHLANFDVVVKERTTPTAYHMRAPWVDELAEVQNIFYQMEHAVEQHRVESKTFEVKMNQALNENERLLKQRMSKYIVNLIINSSMDFASVNVHECEKCLYGHGVYNGYLRKGQKQSKNDKTEHEMEKREKKSQVKAQSQKVKIKSQPREEALE
ncbi:hypothetical protein Tco_0161528 [Tanacetum coccineum]